MIKNRWFFLFVILITISFYCWSQENNKISILKINDIVGDTIAKSEKVRYELFPDVANIDYNFAFCFTENGYIKLRVYKIDSSFIDYDYSAELILNDNEKVVQNQNKTYTEPKNGYKRTIIKLVDYNSNKTLKLRKRKTIELKIKDQIESIAVKIKNVDFVHEPILSVKKTYGKYKFIVPLSNIEYINRITKTDLILKRIVTVMYLSVAVLATLSDPKENYYVGIFFGSIGTYSLLYRNHKFDIDQADIELIYK